MIHAYPWLPTTPHTHIHGYVTVTVESFCTKFEHRWCLNFVQKLSAMSGIIDGVVSKSILEKADIGAANVDWFCILPEKRIVDDSIFS